MNSLLIILVDIDFFDGRAEELAAPYYIFKDAGAHVVVASLKGGKIPMGKLRSGIAGILIEPDLTFGFRTSQSWM